MSCRSRSSNLRQSQRTIAKRLVTLYTTDQASTLEVILGAKQPRRHDQSHGQRKERHRARHAHPVAGEDVPDRGEASRHAARACACVAGASRCGACGREALDRVEDQRAEQSALLAQGPDRAARRSGRREAVADGARGAGATCRSAARLPAAAVDHRGRRLGDRSGGGNGRCAAVDAQQRRQHRAVAARTRRTSGPGLRRADSTAPVS